MKKAISRFACLGTVLFAVSSASYSAILLGNGTLNAPNDLTRIQSNAGVLEYLDLTTTSGQTVAQATSMFGSSGFRWAGGAEIAELFSAFGITYASNPGGIALLGISAGTSNSFVSFLGKTAFPDASFGWFNDGDGGFNSYICIGTDCNSNGFVLRDASFVSAPSPGFGVYLVRDGVSAVPENGSWISMLIGLAVLTARLRRR